MSDNTVEYYRKMIKRIGTWAGIRMMRNRGVGIRQAYFILFDKYPGNNHIPK